MYKLAFFLFLLAFNCSSNTFENFELELYKSTNTTFKSFVPLQQSSKMILEGSGKISGTLYEIDTGELISNDALLRLSLLGRTDENNSWQNIANISIEDSSYVFNDLSAGQYIISTHSSTDINQPDRPLYLPTYWNTNFTIIPSAYNIGSDSIITVSEGDSLENIDFKLTPATLLFITDNQNKGEALKDFSVMNSQGMLFRAILYETTVLDNGISQSTNVLFNYFPIGKYRFYVHSKSEYYNSQNYVDYLYGEGNCYACQLDLLEGKGETISLSKFEKKIINIHRSEGATISGKLTFDESALDLQSNSFVYLKPVHEYRNIISKSGQGMVIDDNFSPNGEYHLSGIAAGEYILYFSRRGYIRQLYKNYDCAYACEYFESYPIRISENEKLINIDASLKKGSAFYGTLSDNETGQGLLQGDKQLLVYTMVEILNEDLSIAGVGDYASTDRTSYVSRHGLPTGNYYIKTGVSSSNYSNENYINQIYPNIECEGNSCDFSQAQLVQLNVDDSIEINFNLNRAKFISGQVLDSSTNQAVANIPIAIINQQKQLVNIGKTDKFGNYRIGGLKSGSYYVRTYNGNKKFLSEEILTANAQSSWLNKLYPNISCVNNNCPFDFSEIIQIYETDIENINLTLDKGYSIQGKITNSVRNIGIQGIEIKIYSEQGLYIDSYFSDEYGFFKTAALQLGNYKLVTTNDRHYVNQAFGGNSCGLGECNPLTSTDITIDNESVDDVNFSLLPGSDYYPQLSGLWYNPDQSGHGFQVEVIKSNGNATLLVSWYVMLNGNSVWLTGTGPLNKDLAFIDLIITSGTNFPPAFDTKEVKKNDWGLLKFNFINENQANISWESNVEGYSNGSMEIHRLTTLSRTINQSNSIDACLSGTYYNQEQDGHGIMLEVLGQEADSMVLTWFVYNQTQQFWLIANGQIQGNSATLPAQYTSGTTFPPDFNAANVQLINWGDLTIDKLNNDTVRLSWFPNNNNQSFGSGSIEMYRLTKIEGINCQ